MNVEMKSTKVYCPRAKHRIFLTDEFGLFSNVGETSMVQVDSYKLTSRGIEMNLCLGNRTIIYFYSTMDKNKKS